MKAEKICYKMCMANCVGGGGGGGGGGWIKLKLIIDDEPLCRFLDTDFVGHHRNSDIA